MKKIKADLHYHGPIGFEPYWLRVQGYQGMNLLRLIADACFKRDLSICALTSVTHQTDEKGIIVRNSVHDRLGYLVENCLSDLNKTEDYKADRLGENTIILEKNTKKLCLINGQTPIIIEGNKRYDHLVVGSNLIPNFTNFRDTLSYCNDHGLLHGLEHPYVKAHYGVGFGANGKALEYVESSDFVEGHNAQLRWSRIFSFIPKIGQFTRKSNDKAKELAAQYKKPYIATSDGHTIESVGIASIEFDKSSLNTCTYSEEALLQGLREIVRSGNFITNEGHESFYTWLKWTTQFQFGISNEKYKQE